MAARKLLSLRQQMRKMSAPSRGIFACSKVLSFRGVQNGFDPCTQSLRSFRRGRPYGAQDGQDGFGVDFIHGLRTKLCSSGRQTPTPLLLVFLVAPLARLCLEKVVSDLAKGHLDGNASCLPSNLNRVPPRTQNLPDLISCCSRLGQTYALIERAQSHLRTAIMPREAIDPCSVQGRRDAKIEAAAVWIYPRFSGRRLAGTKPLNRFQSPTWFPSWTCFITNESERAKTQGPPRTPLASLYHIDNRNHCEFLRTATDESALRAMAVSHSDPIFAGTDPPTWRGGSLSPCIPRYRARR